MCSANINVQHLLSCPIFSWVPSLHVILALILNCASFFPHQQYWSFRLKKGSSIHFISLSSHSMQRYRMMGACYTNTLASVLLLCCGPSQDVHECKSEAWIIDARNDLLFSFFYLQLFLCDKKTTTEWRLGRRESEKSVVKLGETHLGF